MKFPIVFLLLSKTADVFIIMYRVATSQSKVTDGFKAKVTCSVDRQANQIKSTVIYSGGKTDCPLTNKDV